MAIAQAILILKKSIENQQEPYVEVIAFNPPLGLITQKLSWWTRDSCTSSAIEVEVEERVRPKRLTSMKDWWI